MSDSFSQKVKREFAGQEKKPLAIAQREKASENGVLLAIIRKLGRNITEEEYREISKLL